MKKNMLKFRVWNELKGAAHTVNYCPDCGEHLVDSVYEVCADCERAVLNSLDLEDDLSFVFQKRDRSYDF